MRFPLPPLPEAAAPLAAAVKKAVLRLLLQGNSM